MTDGYRDTVEDGIGIVKEYIESLAKDEKKKSLVSMVLRLLSRDAREHSRPHVSYSCARLRRKRETAVFSRASAS